MKLTLPVFGEGSPPAIVFWENVPGVLNTSDNAFGCFLAGLAGEDDPLVPPGEKWSNAGCVFGPARAVAWRVLDAQYFGVAQRRRRVFVVASARNGFDPAAVLFEFDGLRRDTAPSREARQVAPTIPARSLGGGGLGADFDCDGGLIAGTLGANHGNIKAEHAWTGQLVKSVSLRGRDGGATAELGDDVGNCLRASGGGGDKAHVLAPVHCREVAGTITSNYGKQVDSSDTALGPNVVAMRESGQGYWMQDDIAGTLRAEGEDRPSRPSHVIGMPIAFPANLSASQCATAENISPALGAANPTGVAYSVRMANTSSNGWGIQEQVTHTLDCTAGPAVVFDPIRYGDHQQDTLHHESGVMSSLPAGNNNNNNNGGHYTTTVTAMQVRRLTPTECERLQGFPDGYTAIPWRKKPASECPDGPRYKALGNSWAVPVVAWIGQRIAAQLGPRL